MNLQKIHRVAAKQGVNLEIFLYPDSPKGTIEIISPCLTKVLKCVDINTQEDDTERVISMIRSLK